MSAEATLKDICIPSGIQTGPFGSQLHAADYTDDPNGVPVVMPKDIADGKIFDATIARITEDMAQSLSRHRLIVGDIVFGRRGDIGRCALITEIEQGWLCGTGCLRARLDEAVAFPPFVIQYLLYDDARDWLNSNAVGQTMLNLSAGILSELPVPLPSLPEQRAIAAILSTWDDAIALTSRLIDALKRRKQALMQHLLTGQTRFPEFAGEEWDIVGLSSLGRCLRGVSYKPDVDLFPTDTDDTVRLLRANNIEGGMVTRKDLQYVKRQRAKAEQILRQGDIAICMSSGSKEHVGKTARYVPIDPFDYVVGAFCAIFRCDLIEDAEFISHLLQSPEYRLLLSELYAGTNINNLRASDIESLEFEMPMNSDERQRIADVLNISDQQIQLYIKHRDQLQTQKRALMQRLLTGQVRVNLTP